MSVAQQRHLDAEERITRVEEAIGTIRDYIAEEKKTRQIERQKDEEYREKLERQHSEIAGKLGQRGSFTIGALATTMAVVIPFITLLWFVITREVQGSASKLESRIEGDANVVSNSLAALQSRASVSETERHKLNEQVAKNSEMIAVVDQKVMVNDASTKSSLIGVELQDRAIAQFANLREMHTQQILGLLWQKAYGVPLPPGFVPVDVSHNKESSR